MRLIGINNLKPNEKLGLSIFTQDGAVLLPANAVITENYINRLKTLGVHSLYVEDEFFEDVVIKPALKEETKAFALSAMTGVFNCLGTKKPINEAALMKTTKEISEDIGLTIKEPINITNMFAVKDERCHHAVNVATIVAAVCSSYFAEYLSSSNATKDFVLAGLLHDMFLESMDDDESNTKHSEEVYKYLKINQRITSRTYISCLMHHERIDGSGFPQRLKDEKIFLGAKIIAVADLYDSLVHGYGKRKKIKEHQAYEYINSLASSKIDEEIIKHFNKSIAIYPIGASVLLSNGYNAVVVGQTVIPSRPMVRLSMPKREDCILFDLTTTKTLFIEETLS